MMQNETKQHLLTHESQIAMDDMSSVLFEQAVDAILIATTEGQCLEVNTHVCALLGYTRQDLLARNVRDLLVDEGPSTATWPSHLHSGGAILLSQRRMYTSDGRVLDVEIRTYQLRDSHVLMFIRTISEQKRVNQEQQAWVPQEDNLIKVAANTPGVICSFRVRPDGSMYFPYVSSAIVDICGLQPEDLKNNSALFMQRIHPDDLELLNKIVVHSTRDLVPFRTEYRIYHPVKGERWVEGFWTPERETDGGLVWHGFIQDITVRKQTEDQLLYQANVLQHVSDAIITTDKDFVITSWNQAAETMYGWQADEAIGEKVTLITPVQYADDHPDSAYRTLFEHDHWQGEVIQKRKDGTPVTVLSSVSIIRNRASDLLGSVAVNRDITERKRAEEAHAKLETQLRQAQKMESIGRLVGGVAHNFNNLLTVIQGVCELMRTQLASGSPLSEDLEQIREASNRAAALTRELLAFGRKQVLAPTTLDVNRQIAQLRSLLQRIINEDIILSTVLQPDLWPVIADPGQIDQVLMNLVINARDAMPTGGKLTIETRNISPDDDTAQTQLAIPGAPCVMIAITDTGFGIDRYTQSRIFEPFFTTKAFGQGSGMGLATVYGTIKQSGGNISVESWPGHGTTFRLYLPVNTTSAVHVAPSASPSTTFSSHETILLVEDEEQVRRLSKVALNNHGYHVLEASDGIEAITVAEQHRAAIDMLVTDVVMPNMGGRTLAEHLKALQPQIKILFVSGYTDDMMIRHGVLTDEIAFLPKPFSVSELVAKVREVLNT